MKKIWARKATVFEGAAVIIGVWVLSCSTLYACSCAPQGTPEEALRAADAVFRGTVVNLGDMVWGGGGLPSGRRVAFRTKAVWKGPHVKRFVIRTGQGGGDCGFEFVVGRESLVYATRTPQGYSTSLCTRTREVAWLSDRQNAEEDLQALGPGTSISDGNTE